MSSQFFDDEILYIFVNQIRFILTASVYHFVSGYIIVMHEHIQHAKLIFLLVLMFGN